MQLFCRRQLTRQRQRAGRDFKDHSFLHEYSADSFIDRLNLIKRQFHRILITGFMPGSFIENLNQRYPTAEIIYSAPLSRGEARLYPCQQLWFEEENYPFAWGSFDLIISNLRLHWIHDVPGVLAQIRYLLKPQGLFLASIFGEETLHEMRNSFALAESQLTGGIHPRFSPLIDLNMASTLLMRAGYTLPVADWDRLTVIYPNLVALMKDLRGMGEGNALAARIKTFSPRQLFSAASEAYQKRFQTEEGLLPATFDILYLTGWNEDLPKQQKRLATTHP